MINIKKLLCTVFLAFSTSIPADTHVINSEFQFLNNYRTKKGDLATSRAIAIPSYQWKNEEANLDFRFSTLIWGNFSEALTGKNSTVKDLIFRTKNAYGTAYFEHWNFRLGWQTIENGETFGAHRPNYLYPRSYENYVFDSEKIAAVSQPTALAKYLYESGAVEFIYVLKTEDFKLPKYVHDGRVRSDFSEKRYFEDAEESLRWRQMWNPLGVETTLVLSQHYGRVPVYTITHDPNGDKIYLVTSKKIESASLSMNKAWTDWVLRADVTFHNNMPFMIFRDSKYTIKDILDGAIGLQYTWENGSTVTSQLHYVDNHEDESPLYYASVWIKHSLLKDLGARNCFAVASPSRSPS